MTDREAAGPRPDSPGPTTPRLDAVERLRRQLEAVESRAAKRGARSPRKPATPDLGPDLFGRDSADPYSTNAGWTYSEPAEPYSPPAARSTHTAYDATGFAEAGHNLTNPQPPDNTLGPHRRSPTGRRRSPGQWREEASTAPGDGGTTPTPESGSRPSSSTAAANSPRAPRNPAYHDPPAASRIDHVDAEHSTTPRTGSGRAGRRAQAETRTERSVTDASLGPDSAAYRQAEEFLARLGKGAAPRSGKPRADHSVIAEDHAGAAARSRRRGTADRCAETLPEGVDDAHRPAEEFVTRVTESAMPQSDPDTVGGRRGRAGRGRGRRSDSGDGAATPSAPAGGGTESQAKDVCLRLLTDRARSRAELADRLADKGFAAGVAERVLDRLAEVGLIDDAAFAQQWVHSRHTYSGKGKKVLAQELRRKGIAPEDAEPALEAITAEDENARAAELVRRKLQSLSPGLSRDKAISRLVSMLARRGYAPATAYSVVTAELSASGLDLPRETPRTAQPKKPAVPENTDSDDDSDSDGEQADQGSDEDSAAEFVRRKLRTLPPNLDREKVIRRLVGMLARRGYHQSVAYKVVKAELG